MSVSAYPGLFSLVATQYIMLMKFLRSSVAIPSEMEFAFVNASIADLNGLNAAKLLSMCKMLKAQYEYVKHIIYAQLSNETPSNDETLCLTISEALAIF